jgi:hypothetical protein
MKRIKTLSKLAAVSLLGIAMLVATSCGSSKPSQSDMMMMQMMQMMQQQNQNRNYDAQYKEQKNSLGEEIANSPAQLAAEDPKAQNLREWAVYNGFADDDLEYVATNLAKGKLSESLSSWVQTSFANFVDRMTKEGLTSDGMAQKKVRDENTTNKIKNVSENLVEGVKVIVSNRYAQANGTHTAYVCIEIDPNIVIQKVKNDAAILQAITEEEALMIKLKSHLFEEEMKGSFEQLRAAKAAK